MTGLLTVRVSKKRFTVALDYFPSAPNKN